VVIGILPSQPQVDVMPLRDKEKETTIIIIIIISSSSNNNNSNHNNHVIMDNINKHQAEEEEME
jgi:hypothetical protein